MDPGSNPQRAATAVVTAPVIGPTDPRQGIDRLLEVHAGLPLQVKGDSGLTPQLARRLAQHDAELAVTELDSLDDESARELCCHRLLRLGFRIKPRFAGERRRPPQQEASMPLTVPLARILAAHQGILWIDGLPSLSSACASVLARHNGPVLVADETVMAPAADQRLQERAFESPMLREALDLAGEPLRVRGMTSALAEALVFFRDGWLVLDALSDLPPAYAGLLGARRGRLSLNGLGEVCPGVVAKLVAPSIAVPGTYIRSVIDDSSPWPPWTRHLRLNGLSHLRVEVAREFTHFRGTLEFNGIRTLEAKAAACLATVEGEIHLKGLKDLDKETIRVLGPRKHLLRLSPQLNKKLPN